MIPEKAVQAAHAAICEQNIDDCLDPDWRGKCVKAVEAAAPYMLATVWDDALQYAYEEGYFTRPSLEALQGPNPHRSET